MIGSDLHCKVGRFYIRNLLNNILDSHCLGISDPMEEKLRKLNDSYDHFENETKNYVASAACDKGCAFCCIQAGSIDITTLEGVRIRETISQMPRNRQKEIKKVLAREMKNREAGEIVPCPFLQKNNACMIYEVRPFACRRIYSLHCCSKENPPMLSRQYMDMAKETLKDLQRLDENGFSGHISYILYMLESPKFFKTYMEGDFKPEEIMAFGKTHRIVINKMVTE